MTTRTISGTYTNGYTLAAKYLGLSITGSGSISTPTAAHAGGGDPAQSAGVALGLPHGGSLSNEGSIQGGMGGYGLYDTQAGGTSYGDGAAGGTAAVFSSSGSIDNSGAILAGNGGAGGVGSRECESTTVAADGYAGGMGGDGITLAGSVSITNSGTIAGGGGGAGGVGGPGGYGIVADGGGAVSNDGVIRGGAGGAGGAAGYNQAGWRWASRHGVRQRSRCTGRSRSFSWVTPVPVALSVPFMSVTYTSRDPPV